MLHKDSSLALLDSIQYVRPYLTSLEVHVGDRVKEGPPSLGSTTSQDELQVGASRITNVVIPYPSYIHMYIYIDTHLCVSRYTCTYICIYICI